MSKKSSKTLAIRNSTAEFLIFTRQAGEDGIEVRYQDETIWLTQKLLAELFDVSIPTINEHLKNIFDSGELRADSVIRKFRITAADGKNYNTQFYNLDATISVGYRVNSHIAARFHHWAMQQIKKYAIKSFASNDKRLKNSPADDGIDGLLDRVMEMYLDYAEIKAKRREPMTMKQWAEKFDVFLQFDENELRRNPCKVEAEVAKCLAE